MRTGVQNDLVKQIAFVGLFLCILMIGEVRGQDVITKSRLHNNIEGDISVAETQIIEIFSIFGHNRTPFQPPLISDYVVTPIVIRALNYDQEGGNPWSYIEFVLDTGTSAPPTLPAIISGPCRISVNPFACITYRILPKQGYSPNISPTGLASNTNFVSGLTQTILSTSNSYGLASRTELIQSLAESRADGVNSVLNNPNQWTLYTTNQISAMAIGDLVLTRTNNGQFVLNYDIEQSEDLVNWYPYQGFAMPLTNLPTNKAFVRIKAKQ